MQLFNKLTKSTALLRPVASRAVSQSYVKVDKLCAAEGGILRKPDYLNLLPKQKHFLVDIIDDEEGHSPYVFLQSH